MTQPAGHAQMPPRHAPGHEMAPLERDVTQAVIDAYADATGDHNPIHVDPEYARTGPFGQTIAHGLMTLSFAAQMLNHWSGGAFDTCGALEVAFIGPVHVGETIRLTGRVKEIDADRMVICTVECMAGERRILAGTARLPLEQLKQEA